MKKIIFFFSSLLLLSACNTNNESTIVETKTLPVFRITVKDTLITNKFVADIQAEKNVEIHARISGIMDQVLVNEGQAVKKGQTLFKLNDDELQIELLKTQAALKNASADLRIAAVEMKQMQLLFDKKVIADNELELAKAKHEAAEAKVAFAQAERNAVSQKISFTTIKAPFDGVIDRIPLKEGSLIQVGILLTTLSELDEIFAYFSLPENTYFQLLTDNKLNTQRSIELILPNGEVYDEKGSLETADAEIDKYTGSIQFKAKFLNPARLIKHGSSGKLVISENKPKAILIPKKSVFSIQDKRFVFVVSKNNIVKMRSVNIANTLDDFYLVDHGIKVGEIIVQEGTQSLRDGERIIRKNKL